MNSQEAAKLLALIKLAYPTAYRDIDKETAQATVSMWQMSFPDVPYPIMEQAFNHFRMVSKFPPTVAEMVAELRHIYFEALECALTQKSLGNEEMVKRFREIMAVTARFKDDSQLGGLNINTLPRLGGSEYVGLPGAPGH
jgi:hypothetical protein